MGSVASPTGPRVLPPNFDEGTFNNLLEQFAKVIGRENISFDGRDGSLAGIQDQTWYGDVWPLDHDDEHSPSAALRPRTVSELQQIVKIANEHKLPLWTVSRGKNLAYGGTAPVVRGTVVLDLHRMNKIIEVHEEFAYAIVEPGVSFFDLYDYIVEKGYALWPSVPAIGWGSVLGNTTDRGFGYTPYGEHATHQCGMEVVLANGELLRTGMGAMEGSPMFALYKVGYGPSVDGLFSQTNLGIVTKIGIHLMPAPTHFLDCSVSVPREEDLEILTKKLSRLTRDNLIQNHTSIANLWRQAMTDPDPKVQAVAIMPGMEKGQCASDADLAKLQEEKGWGFWKGYFAIYAQSGTIAQGNWELVQKAFADVPGAQLTCVESTAKEGERLRAPDTIPGVIPHNGVPTLDPVGMVNVRGYGGGHVDFSPLFPPDGKELAAWYLAAKACIKESNLDFFADFHVYGRYVIAIICIIYGPKEGAPAKRAFNKLLLDATKRNITEYRTHIDFMDHVADSFTFENLALKRFVTGLKQHMDPNGILSQGKSGIWTQSKAR